MAKESLEEYVASKVNTGARVLNYSPVEKTATIVATGLGRSGTTMLARILGGLSLEMGAHRHPNTYDDKEIQTIARRGEWERFEGVCRRRDAESDVWAFKDPKIRERLAPCVSVMRNPRLIVIFRDILAISMRNEISAQTEIWDSMRRAIKSYNQLVSSLEELNCPILLLSYEKCLMRPEEMVSEISEFCGLDYDAGITRRVANEVIKESDPLYLSYNYK